MQGVRLTYSNCRIMTINKRANWETLSYTYNMYNMAIQCQAYIL